jgi:hypothetical protein
MATARVADHLGGSTRLQLASPTTSLLETTAKKTAKNNKIKPQETRGFNVENTSNAKGKNHGCQAANLYYIRCVFTKHNDGLQE